MYDTIALELVEPNSQKRFLGDRSECRYCGTKVASAFGRKTNAHAFPAALGNRALFSLDECKSCNTKFSVYEDALVKAIGPFLTLGGVKGRSGVRQTGRSNARSTIRHGTNDDKRHLSVTSEGSPDDLAKMNRDTRLISLRMPVEGDSFIPRYAYKALLKTAVSLLPKDELPRFKNAISCLGPRAEIPYQSPLKVGFSYAYVGNAPPALAGCLLRRTDASALTPYMMFIFMAGSVCFQICVRSDDADDHLPDVGRLGIKWTAQFPKPEGGYLPIQYSDPLQFDWTDLTPSAQPFEAFELIFDPRTTEGEIIPIPRQ